MKAGFKVNVFFINSLKVLMSFIENSFCYFNSLNLIKIFIVESYSPQWQATSYEPEALLSVKTQVFKETQIFSVLRLLDLLQE